MLEPPRHWLRRRVTKALSILLLLLLLFLLLRLLRLLHVLWRQRLRPGTALPEVSLRPWLQFPCGPASRFLRFSASGGCSCLVVVFEFEQVPFPILLQLCMRTSRL